MHYAYTLVAGILTLAALTVFLVDLFYYDKPDLPGTQEVNNVNLGFGPEKQLIIFDFDVSTIDLSDKKFCTITWSYTKNGTTTTQSSPAGIEVKGSGLDERPKLNYAFEFWEPLNASIPCTSIETCDDSKAEMFGFGEDYEDYVLRGGYKEPTLVRDALPSQMDGGILQHTLVEVLFKNNGTFYYEGVYLLYPAIQRRVLEKRLNWASKGKKEDCEDNPTQADIQGTALIGEYTNSGAGSRKKTCDWLDMIKMRYPKCDIGTCYHEHIKSYFSLLTMTNTSEVKVDLTSFAKNFLAEALMMNGDFPLSSQYFYKDPDGTLYSGPRWDFDYLSWRFADTETWDVKTNYGAKHAKFWEHLGKHTDFIKLLNDIRVNTTTINHNKAKEVIAERKAQFEAGYFDRNIARWNGYGNRVVPYTKDFNLVKTRVKDNWAIELKYIEDTFDTRAAYMKRTPITEINFHYDGLFILRNLFTLIPFLLTFAGIVITTTFGILLCTIKEEEEEEEMVPLKVDNFQLTNLHF